MSYTTSRRHRSKSFTTRSVAATGSSSFPFPRLPPVPSTTATTQRPSPALALRKAATRSMQQLKATFASCTPQRKRSSTVVNVFDPRTTTTPSCTSPSSSPSARPSTPRPLLSLDDIMGKPNSSTTSSRKLKHRISYPLLMSCSSSPIVEKREDWHKWGVREEEQAVQERDRDGDDEERGRGGNGRVMGLWMDSDDSLVDPRDGGLARSLSRATTTSRIEYDDVESEFGDDEQSDVGSDTRSKYLQQESGRLLSRWSLSLSTLENLDPVALVEEAEARFAQQSSSPTSPDSSPTMSRFSSSDYSSIASSRYSFSSQPSSIYSPGSPPLSPPPAYGLPPLPLFANRSPSTEPSSPSSSIGYSFARTSPLRLTPPRAPRLQPAPAYRLRPPPLHLLDDIDDELTPTPTPTRTETFHSTSLFDLPPSPSPSPTSLSSFLFPSTPTSPSPDQDIVRRNWFSPPPTRNHTPSPFGIVGSEQEEASSSDEDGEEGEDWTSSTIGAETTRATTVEEGTTREVKAGVEEERVGWECLEKVQRRSV